MTPEAVMSAIYLGDVFVPPPGTVIKRDNGDIIEILEGGVYGADVVWKRSDDGPIFEPTRWVLTDRGWLAWFLSTFDSVISLAEDCPPFDQWVRP